MFVVLIKRLTLQVQKKCHHSFFGCGGYKSKFFLLCANMCCIKMQ